MPADPAAWLQKMHAVAAGVLSFPSPHHRMIHSHRVPPLACCCWRASFHSPLPGWQNGFPQLLSCCHQRSQRCALAVPTIHTTPLLRVRSKIPSMVALAVGASTIYAWARRHRGVLLPCLTLLLVSKACNNIECPYLPTITIQL